MARHSEIKLFERGRNAISERKSKQPLGRKRRLAVGESEKRSCVGRKHS